MRRVRAFLTGVPGSPYVSNMYFADTVSHQDAADKFAEFWIIVQGAMVEECQWAIEPVVVDIEAGTGEMTGSTTVTGGVGQGTATGEMLPPTSQVLVQWRTGSYIAGRELRGKTNVPALDAFCNDGGVVLGSIVTGLTSDLGGWLAVGPAPLIWSRAHLESRPVIDAGIWTQFAVLRSRRD